jgi:hypothetical protein
VMHIGVTAETPHLDHRFLCHSLLPVELPPKIVGGWGRNCPQGEVLTLNLTQKSRTTTGLASFARAS